MIILFKEPYKLSLEVDIEKISSILYYDFTKDFVFKGEAHDYWELVYTDRGEIIATAEDSDFFIKQGEIIFHKPNEFHKLRCNGVIAPNVIVISFHTKSSAMQYFHNKHLKVPPEYRWIIAKIIEEGERTFIKNAGKSAEEKPIGGEQLIKSYLEMLFIYLMREDEKKVFFSEKNISENKMVCDIINIMEESIKKDFDIPMLCKMMGYSKTYLCTLFKKQTGFGIMQYYMQMKIGESKKLLREKNYNITEIASILNFSNSHYFSHVFSKVTGMSPREYIKSVSRVEDHF